MATMEEGEVAVIKEITAPDELRNRFMALGITPGQKVTLVRKAKFNGPLHIRLSTTDLIIRRKDAKYIKI